MAVLFTYVGDGSYLPGIPARDITDADELTPDQLADVKASPIYKAAMKTAAAPAPSEGE